MAFERLVSIGMLRLVSALLVPLDEQVVEIRGTDAARYAVDARNKVILFPSSELRVFATPA